MYKRQGLWKGGELERLHAKVSDDGQLFTMLVKRIESKMHVELQDQSYTTVAPIVPTNHWNSHVLKYNRVLNTLTGKVNEVKLISKGRELVSSERGEVAANRYLYTGDLEDTEVWYDDAGRWVKLRFLGRDGTPVEYVCQKCMGND